MLTGLPKTQSTGLFHYHSAASKGPFARTLSHVRKPNVLGPSLSASPLSPSAEHYHGAS